MRGLRPHLIREPLLPPPPRRFNAIVLTLSTVLAAVLAAFLTDRIQSFSAPPLGTRLTVFEDHRGRLLRGWGAARPPKPPPSSRNSLYASLEEASSLRGLQFLEGGWTGPIPHPAHRAFPICRSSRDRLRGNWVLSAGGEPEWEPRNCRLSKISADDARACLAGRRVAVVGDSLQRYQYLSLAHFLTRKAYPYRYGRAGVRSVCREKDWGTWDAFFDGTARLFGRAVGGWAAESCDCIRAGNGSPDRDVSETRERRHLRLAFPHPRVESVPGVLGSVWGARRAVTDQPMGSLDLHFRHSWNWPGGVTASAVDALRSTLIDLKPDVIVAGIAAWMSKDDSNKAIMRSAPRVVAEINRGFVNTTWIKRPYAPRLIWQAGTCSHRGCNNTDARRWAAKYGWEFIDNHELVHATARAGMATALRHDGNHFECRMNEAFVDVLLDSLCIHATPATPGGAAPGPLRNRTQAAAEYAASGYAVGRTEADAAGHPVNGYADEDAQVVPLGWPGSHESWLRATAAAAWVKAHLSTVVALHAAKAGAN